ncbi:hypothetical protein OIU80_15530 [Flavobacterium sp. LS1R47]|jgi:hypothetical protein|uniref:Uncharacterized protein n=1 Tax=Flavobacterium frigoritolerans TaxID=2987686 RepID=A0A9X2Z1E4_9FLAO|nr:hypothetical protein [Flavobacterium frigoritolerans]MCV9933694.1 hypothetical protein [Flavobacterium frigoritolerans]
MSTNTLTKETELRLADFLNESIDPISMAKSIRRINHILALTVIRNDDNRNPINKYWLENDFYWLNELAEILNPHLEVE